jgi:hypothetical protein
VRAHESLLFSSSLGYLGFPQTLNALQCYHPVNTIRAKDTEFAFVVAAEIDLATAPFGGAGQGHLVNRPHTLAIFIFKEDDRLAGHGSRETEVSKLDDLAADGLLRGGEYRLGIHSTIEAEAMYLLK